MRASFNGYCLKKKNADVPMAGGKCSTPGAGATAASIGSPCGGNRCGCFLVATRPPATDVLPIDSSRPITKSGLIAVRLVCTVPIHTRPTRQLRNMAGKVVIEASAKHTATVRRFFVIYATAIAIDLEK